MQGFCEKIHKVLPPHNTKLTARGKTIKEVKILCPNEMNETSSSLPPPIPSSNQSLASAHPFDRFRARFMILVCVALVIGSAVFIMTFLHNEGFDVRGADEKLAIILVATVASLAMPLSAAIFPFLWAFVGAV